MARFRLMKIPNNGHYLNTDPPTEWEQVEVDQKTGRQVRHRYKVPMHLDPDDPFCHTHPETGDIFLSTRRDPAFPRDLVFVGQPTLGMEALDAEGEAMLAKLPQHGPMSEFALPSTGGFGPAAPAAAPVASELTSLLAQLQAQNAVLVAQMDAMQQKIAELSEDEPLPPPPAPEPEPEPLRL